jgi:DNA topoisomerase I
MAIKDFLPVDDAKQIIEKQVHQKPSLKELTKVESPGRPVPASNFESTKKKIRKTKRSTSDPSTIKQPKREYTLIITEKPQAAQKIALALSSSAQKITSGDRVSYYEISEKKIIVASAVGHLFNLTYKSGQKGYPIFEIEWAPSYNTKSGAFTKRYFTLLEKLSRKAKDFIIATDYDIEGEVIGWNVLKFICKQKTAKRMKFSTLTPEELQESYKNLQPEPNWGNAYAGETRHILDWLYGINLSRALMAAIKTSGSFKILSIGRVQGPALKIIVDREREIQKFKSEPYFQITVKTPDSSISYKHPNDIFDKKELEPFKEIKSAQASTTESQSLLPPQPPLDLTTLQREAYRLHKVSPSATLKIAQKLYLDGVISYPRTSSQKIPIQINPKKILKSLSKKFPKEVFLATRSSPIEGKKSDPAHPSIFPTGSFSALETQAEKIYQIIARRFISCFAPDAITLNKRTELKATENPKLKFTASGLKVLEKGWTQIYPLTLQEKEIPTLNGEVKISKVDFIEKETQAPKRYTPTSLITILENKNLGTKATRSSIVDTLFDRGYLDGKSIQATPLGLHLIEALEKNSPIIIDENLTRQLEHQMESLEEKSDPIKLEEEKNKVISLTKILITDISKEFKAREIQIGKDLSKGILDLRQKENESNTLIQCPTCKKGDLRILYGKAYKRYFIGCSNYKEGCKQTFSLPPGALIKKAQTDCEQCKFPKLLSIKKGRRPWEFCFNTKCPINIKKREAWEAKKKNG